MSRKADPNKVPLENLTIKMPVEVIADVKAIAVQEDKTSSVIGWRFVTRGLAAYRRDHQLEEPAASEGEQDASFSNPFGLPIKGKTATFISLHQLYGQLLTTADKRAIDELLAVLGREMEWRIKRAVKE